MAYDQVNRWENVKINVVSITRSSRSRSNGRKIENKRENACKKREKKKEMGRERKGKSMNRQRK
jgi:hypothetical protein